MSTVVACRISVYQDGSKTKLATLKPTALVALLATSATHELEEVAREAEEVLVRIMKEAV